jgi:hypothetical protein
MLDQSALYAVPISSSLISWPLTLFSEDYKLRSSSLCSVLHSPVTSLLNPDVPLTASLEDAATGAVITTGVGKISGIYAVIDMSTAWSCETIRIAGPCYP